MFLTLLTLLFSNAVTSNKDKSILHSSDGSSKYYSVKAVSVNYDLGLYLRVTLLSLLFIILLLIDNFYVSPLITGIGIYAGLFNITISSHALNIFIYLIISVIIIKVIFFNGNLKDMLYLLFLYAIVTVNFKLLSFIMIKVFNLLFLASILANLSPVMIIAVRLGLKGQTRSSMFYFSIFSITYIINIFMMWVQFMIGTAIDPLNIYPLLYILGLNHKALLDNVSCISYLNHVPWDNKPIGTVCKFSDCINPGVSGPPRILGSIYVSLNHPYYIQERNFDGRTVLVAYNNPRVDRVVYPQSSQFYPWKLSDKDRLDQNTWPITWFWGNWHDQIVFPHNPRLDSGLCVYNIFKDNKIACKQYFMLKEQAMIRYSYLNMEQTRTNLFLLNEQKDLFGYKNGKPKL